MVVSLAGATQTSPPAVNAAQIRPAMLAWRIGTNRPEGPSRMVEAISRSTFQDRPTWRVTHYPEDPASESNFDLYDVDPETLTPLRSVMRTTEFSLELLFTPKSVTYSRVANGETVVEQIPLAMPVKPEGPGMRVFLASLPLRAGYTTQFRIVDRWSGKDASRVKPLTLSVDGPRPMSTPMGPRDALEVSIRPDDGSFRIVERVRAEPPHYPFSVEYVRGKTTLLSDVTAMAIEQAPNRRR